MEIRYCDRCNGIITPKPGARLPDPGQPTLCPECQAGGGAAAKGPEKAPGSDFIPKDALELFSASTIAIRKDQMKKAIATAGASPAGAAARGGAPPAAPSAPAAPPAIQFACLHCQVRLKIRPVENPSRMTCPKCKGVLFIDPSGVPSKTAPAGAATAGGAAGTAGTASGETKAPSAEAPPKQKGILGAGFRRDAHPTASGEPAPPAKESVPG